jgi:uncharacterized protein
VNIDRKEMVRLTEEHGGVWGISHVRRVMVLIELIGADQDYDQDVIWVATHLHDWGAYPHWAEEGVHHAVRSKVIAEQFLTERGYPADFITRVLEVIEFHHDPHPARSIEAILLCDADALDFLGVVGVLRIFSKQTKNLRKAFDIVKQKRAALADCLVLEAAKVIAVERVAQTDALLAAFEQETFGYF